MLFISGKYTNQDQCNDDLNEYQCRENQWMIGQHLQQAEIRLNPPELGLLEVKIQIQSDQANVSFSSPNAQVREALESALPRLREMFSESGLELGNASVSQDSSAQEDTQNESAKQSGSGSNTGLVADENSDDGAHTTISHINNDGNGLLDVFA